MKKICPFCKNENIDFEPFGFEFEILSKLKVVGGGKRDNARCPICFSMDRERLVYLYLKNFTNIFTDSLSVLHVAPEKRLRDKIRTNEKLNYITADLQKKFVDMNFNLCNIPFENNTFDIIICNHVLEHIIDDKKAMKEIFRILKPFGIAILQVPFSNLLEKTYEDNTIVSKEQRELHFGQNDHVRIYGKDYPNKLTKIGFEVEKFIWQEHQQLINEDYSLLMDEPIFIAKRNK